MSSSLNSKEEKPLTQNNYWSIIKSLMYLTYIRSDIAFVLGVASRFMEDPRCSHLKVVKRILIYVKGIEDPELFY
jgi:hypothetical protein